MNDPAGAFLRMLPTLPDNLLIAVLVEAENEYYKRQTTKSMDPEKSILDQAVKEQWWGIQFELAPVPPHEARYIRTIWLAGMQ